MFQSIGEMVVLFLRTVQALPKLWRQKQKVFDQLFDIGNASLLMACVLSLFIGGSSHSKPARYSPNTASPLPLAVAWGQRWPRNSRRS